MFSYGAHLSIDVHCSTKLKKIILFYLTFLSLPIKIIHLFLSLSVSFFSLDSNSQPSLFLLYLFNIISPFFLRDRRWRKRKGWRKGWRPGSAKLATPFANPARHPFRRPSSPSPPLSPTQLAIATPLADPARHPFRRPNSPSQTPSPKPKERCTGRAMRSKRKRKLKHGERCTVFWCLIYFFWLWL